MRYYVEVGERTLVVELTGEGVRVDGREFEAELASLPDGPLLHLRLGDRGHSLAARREDGSWTLRLEGRKLSARVEDERTRALRELAGGSDPVGGPRELRAPMPGLVVRVLVEEGQEVQAGDGLVVMEAMKMENELSAGTAGRVKEIRAREGRTVNQNDVLVVLS